MTNQALLNDLNTQLDSLLPLIMDIHIENEDNVEEIVQRIKDKYLNGSNVITPANEQRLIDVKTN